MEGWMGWMIGGWLVHGRPKVGREPAGVVVVGGDEDERTLADAGRDGGGEHGAWRWSPGARENSQGTFARFTVLSVAAGLRSARRALATTCSARWVEGPSIPPMMAQTLST